MAKPSAAGALLRAHYTDATERTFRQALMSLEKTLPTHHDALAVLVDEGRFDDVEALIALLEENGT